MGALEKTKESGEELNKLHQRVTELKTLEARWIEAEKLIRENENRLKFLVNNSNEIVLILSKRGKIIFANERAVDNFGYSREELIGKSISHFLTRNFTRVALSALIQEFLGRPQPEMEIQAKTKAGEIRYLSVAEGSVPVHENGNMIGVMICANDITEQRRAEEKLKRSEKNYRDLVEKAGIAIFVADREGNFKYFNARYAETFGYTRKELEKLSIWTTIHPDDREKIKAYYRGCFKDKEIPSRYEFKGVRKDGSVIYLEVNVVVLKDGERPIGTQSYLTDITERKQAGEILQKRNAQLELVYRIQSEIPANANIETILFRAAESIGKSFGYYKVSINLYDQETDEIVYLTGWNKTGLTLPRGHGQKLGLGLIGKAGLLKQTIVANDISREPDYVSYHLTETKSELVVPLLFQEQLIGVVDLQATRVNAFSKDDISVLQAIAIYIASVIDSKQREEAVRQSERRYRELADSITDVFIAFDKNLRYTYWNRASEELTGIPAKDAIGKSLCDLFPDTSQTRKVEEVYRDVLRTQQPQTFVNEYQLGGKDFFFEISVYPSKEGIAVFSRDITKRKRVEEELKNSEERFRMIFEYAPDAYYLNDLKGNFIDGNRAAEELTNYKREELIGKSFLGLKLLSPDQILKAAKLLAKNAIGMPTGPDEFVLKRKNNSSVSAEIRTYPVKVKGKTLVLGIARDITKRKQAEEALYESEEKFRSISDSAQDAILMMDNQGNISYWNKAAEKIFGHSAQEALGKELHTFITPIHYQETYKEAFCRFKNTGKGSAIGKILELRATRKDGAEIPIELSISATKIKGKWSAVGIIRDVAERRLAMKSLKESEMKYRALFECANDAIFHMDFEGVHVLVNKKAADMLGYSDGELIGVHHDKVIAPSECQSAQVMRKDVWEGKSVPPRERIFRKKNGVEFTAEVSRALIRDTEGKPLYIQIIARDSTERRRAENELKKTTQKLKNSLESIVNVIAATVELRDPYTAGHQIRVAGLAGAVAAEMGLSKDRIEGIHIAGAIHDIGKIAIPAEILSKPGKLNEFEFSLIKNHVQVGYEILKKVEFPWPVAQILYQHHERLDGSGYPHGLSRKELLLEAKILGVADVVEAMASHRPYRPALGVGAALEHILDKKDALYDPEVVDVCVKLFSESTFKFE